jgi:hypothetical protein
MPDTRDIPGTAALTICESLLLALNDLDIIPEHKIINILEDAAATHENAPREGGDPALHEGVAALIRKIIRGGNSVRRRAGAGERRYDLPVGGCRTIRMLPDIPLNRVLCPMPPAGAP